MKKFAHLREHIEKLYTFTVVARAGSLSAAALNLRVSQAGISHCIKTLEAVLDTDLFIRSSKGMTLTPSGKILLEFSRRLFHDLEAVEAFVRNPNAEGVGRFRIGTHETLAIHVWPSFLSRLSEQYPNLLISLMSGRVNGLVQGLKSGDHDVIVTVEPAEDPALLSIPLYGGDFAFFAAAAVPARFPELAKRKLRRDDVDRVPILTDAFAEVRQFTPIPMFLVQQGFRLDRFFELNSFEAAIQLAGSGLGLAFLPKRNAARAVNAGQLRQVAVEGVPANGFGAYQICATLLKARQSDPLAQQVIAELTSNFL